MTDDCSGPGGWGLGVEVVEAAEKELHAATMGNKVPTTH